MNKSGHFSWHLDVGFDIIGKLTNKPEVKKYKIKKRRKPTMKKPKKDYSVNPLCKSGTLRHLKASPTLEGNMQLLRNSILPVTQDFDRVLKWLNTVTI